MNRALWYAVWTRSHCEQIAADQLASNGHTVFLPKTLKWGRGLRGRVKTEQPLFPGYFFLRASLDKPTHVDVLKARGVVRVLGTNWDCLSAVPDEEIDAMQRVVTCGEPAFRYEPIQDGQRVRIVNGPLQGLDGRFIAAKPSRGVFLVSISLLQRSVATTVDATCVVPV